MGGFLDQLVSMLSAGGAGFQSPVTGVTQFSALDPQSQQKQAFNLLNTLFQDPSVFASGTGEGVAPGDFGGLFDIGSGTALQIPDSLSPSRLLNFIGQGLSQGTLAPKEGTNFLQLPGSTGVNSPLSLGQSAMDFLGQQFGTSFGSPGVPISGGGGQPAPAPDLNGLLQGNELARQQGLDPSQAGSDRLGDYYPLEPPPGGGDPTGSRIPPPDWFDGGGGGAGGGGGGGGTGGGTGGGGGGTGGSYTSNTFPQFPSGGQQPFIPSLGAPGTEGAGLPAFLPGDRFDRNIAFGGNAFLEALIPYFNANPFPNIQGGLAGLFGNSLQPGGTLGQFGSPLGTQYGNLFQGTNVLQNQFNPNLDVNALNALGLQAQQLGYFQRYGLPNQQQQLDLSSALQGFGGDLAAQGSQGLRGMQGSAPDLQAILGPLIGSGAQQLGLGGQAANLLFNDTRGGQLANPELIRAFQGLSNGITPFQTGSPFPNGPNPDFPFNSAGSAAQPLNQPPGVTGTQFGNITAPGIQAQPGQTQSAAEQGVLDLIQRGGTPTSDAYQAQERQLLAPALEASRNQYQSLAGPNALLDSSDQQERERKLRRDFMDQQLIQSNQNLLTGLGQAGQLGQQAFGQQFGLGQANAGNLQRAGEFNTNTLLNQVPIQAALQNQMFNQRSGLVDLFNRSGLQSLQGGLQGQGQGFQQGLDLNQALLNAGFGNIQTGQGIQSQLTDQYFNMLNPAIERSIYGPLQNQQALELANRGYGLQELQALQQFLQGQQAFGQGNLQIGGQLFSSLLGGQPPRDSGSTLGGILQAIGSFLPVIPGISSEKYKENIRPADPEKAMDAIRGMEVSEWNYRPELGMGTSTRIGPVIEHNDPQFAVGDRQDVIQTINTLLAAVQHMDKRMRQGGRHA